MAKKEEKFKVVLERTYIVPLRKDYLKAPSWRRTPRAVKFLRDFMLRHMKGEKVLIGRFANELLWKHGMKNPPRKLHVHAIKDDKGVVKVELVQLPAAARRQDERIKALKQKKDRRESGKKGEEKKASEKDKKEQALEKVVEEAKEIKQEKGKTVEKEEIKEIQHEHHKVKAPRDPVQPQQVEQHQSGPKHQ